jgi:hypothetical protein
VPVLSSSDTQPFLTHSCSSNSLALARTEGFNLTLSARNRILKIVQNTIGIQSLFQIAFFLNNLTREISYRKSINSRKNNSTMEKKQFTFGRRISLKVLPLLDVVEIKPFPGQHRHMGKVVGFSTPCGPAPRRKKPFPSKKLK